LDKLISSVSEFAAGLEFDDIPAEVAGLANRLLVDTLGCAAGGYFSEPARIARRLLPTVDPASGSGPGTVYGLPILSTPELAAFANTCTIRYLDYNDFYPASHPSDMVGGLLAFVGWPGVSGRAFLTAMTVAYEVSGRVSDASGMRREGWDQGYAIGLGTVAGLGSLLGCDASTIAHALSITATANVHLRNTRAGLLSLWKGSATAYAVRNGVFAVLLAREGMTGPESPIEGRHGLWDKITGPFELAAFPGEPAAGPAREGTVGGFLMPRTTIKYWPTEYNTQAAIFAAIELRKRVSLEDLAEVSIGTYWSSWHEVGSEPAKWDPRTRETADHSMPYIFAAVLRDGTLADGVFEPASYLDPALRPHMDKIKIYLDDECDKAFPDHILMKIDATDRDGNHYSFQATDPVGYWTNPMNDQQVEDKFTRQTEPVLGPAATRQLLGFWRDLPAHDTLTPGLNTIPEPAHLSPRS
jgi:2-methylcitrate dehydratase